MVLNLLLIFTVSLMVIAVNAVINYSTIVMFQLCHSFYNPTDSGAVSITSKNLDMVLGRYICLRFHARSPELLEMDCIKFFPRFQLGIVTAFYDFPHYFYQHRIIKTMHNTI